MKARVAFLVSLLLCTGVVLWAWNTFPDRVPVHWGGGGDADHVVYLVVVVGIAANSALRRYRPRDTA